MAGTATRSAKALLMLGLVWVGIYWWSKPTVPGLVLASVERAQQPASKPPPQATPQPSRTETSERADRADGVDGVVRASSEPVAVRPAEPTPTIASEPTGNGPSRPRIVYELYTVRRGDTLTRIAKARYGSVRYARMIYRANRDRLASPDTLSLGQQLRLPTDAGAWERADAGER